MCQYNPYNFQNMESAIEEGLLKKSIKLIKEYNQNHCKYHIAEYKYELDIVLLDNVEQGRKLFPKLNHLYAESFFAVFHPVKNENKGFILIYVEKINDEARNMYYLPETIFLFFLAHEIQHYIQCEFLGIDKFNAMIHKEREGYNLNIPEQMDKFYETSNLENDANNFSYNFLKNIKEYKNANFYFNKILFEDIEIFCQRYFPNRIVYDKQNGHESYRKIKEAKKVNLVIKFLIIPIFILYFLYNVFQ